MNNQYETKKFYNNIAQKSFDEWFDNPLLLPTLSGFINKLPEKPSVLDLGCGTGGESKRLVQLGAHVTGIDFSDVSVAIARKNVPGAHFFLMDINDMHFQENSFDGVVEAAVLFHFEKHQQDKILDNILSVLKENGRYLSYYPEGDFEGMQEMDVDGKKYHRYARMVPVQVWIDQVLGSGFKDHCVHDLDLGPFKCVEFSL